MAKKQPSSGMDIDIKSMLKTTYMFDKDGNPTFAGDWVSKDLSKPGELNAVATGEDFSSDELEDVGTADGSNFA